MMDQFSSEIDELSMKSMLNKITERRSRVFIFKGPPGCGKTELISRVCSYWAKHYALRQFSLVLYVNVWDVHQYDSFRDLIDGQFKGSTVSSERVCHWIQEEKGHGILFILDGFCRKYLYRSSLREGDILFDILSGSDNFSKSTVVVSTTCSDFVKPMCENFTQFEILGLSDEQVGMQVIQHFGSETAFSFLSYLAGNPEIKGLASSPSSLCGIMYAFARISYDDLPVTWTQLYTSLVVLINEWHDIQYFGSDSLLNKLKFKLLKRGRKINKYLPAGSLQSQFKNTLLEKGRKVVKDSGDLTATVGKILIENANECDRELPDHNSAVPHLENFLSSLETLLNPHVKNLDKAVKDKDTFAYFWYFLARLGAETNSDKLSHQYCGRNLLETAKCLSETRYFKAEQQADLSYLKVEVSCRVITTCDICSFLHCLPCMQHPHTVILNKCCLGTQTVRELSKFLAANFWIDDYNDITHLW